MSADGVYEALEQLVSALALLEPAEVELVPLDALRRAVAAHRDALNATCRLLEFFSLVPVEELEPLVERLERVAAEFAPGTREFRLIRGGDDA